jgi:hypothetical protein
MTQAITSEASLSHQHYVQQILEKDLATKQEPPKAPLSLFYREHKELLDHLAGSAKTRVRCCAAKVINLFIRWRDWKIPLYRTGWIYHTLKDIREELCGEHSIHVIREALTLLTRLGFLHRRQNERADNWRNGQDKTYQYLIRSDRIEQELARLSGQARTRTTAPFVRSESSIDNPDSSTFIVETQSQIPSTNSFPKSLGKREEDVLTKEDEGYDHTEPGEHSSTASCPEAVPGRNPERSGVEQGSLAPSETSPSAPQLPQLRIKPLSAPRPEIEQEMEIRGDNTTAIPQTHYSAPPLTLKYNKLWQISPLAGFESIEERDGFYHALLELGKHKSDVRSPAAWASRIVKSVNAGDPCEYLNEYRQGVPVGSFEKQEWEIAPGRPYDRFVSYLKRKFKANHLTDEQAVKAAFEALRDSNQAQALWLGFKGYIANLKENWDNQQALGVSSAYLPAELLPEREVSLEEAAVAMQELEGNCVSTQSLQARNELAVLALSSVDEQSEGEDSLERLSNASQEVKEEATLGEELAILQAQWRNFKDKPQLKSLLSLIAMKVEATPGLVMTQEGPALAQDGFQTALGEQLSVTGSQGGIEPDLRPATSRGEGFLLPARASSDQIEQGEHREQEEKVLSKNPSSPNSPNSPTPPAPCLALSETSPSAPQLPQLRIDQLFTGHCSLNTVESATAAEPNTPEKPVTPNERTSVRYRYKGERAAYGNVGKPDGGVYNGVIESGTEVTIWDLTEEDYELNPGEVYVRPVSGASNWLRSLKVRFFDLEPL